MPCRDSVRTTHTIAKSETLGHTPHTTAKSETLGYTPQQSERHLVTHHSQAETLSHTPHTIETSENEVNSGKRSKSQHPGVFYLTCMAIEKQSMVLLSVLSL